MTDQTWYYHHAGTQNGPVTLDELQRLAASGGLDPEDLVWQQGMPGWVPASTVEGLLPKAEPAPPPAAPAAPTPPPGSEQPASPKPVKKKAPRASGPYALLPHLRLVEGLLELLRRLLSERLLDAIDGGSKMVGHFAYLAAAGLSFLFFVILAIRASTLPMVLVALGVLPIAILLQFAAVLFLDAGTTLIEKSPSRLSSVAFLDCFGLVALVGALAQLCLGVYGAFAGGGFPAFATGLGAFLILVYAGGVALNPSSVNVSVGREVRAGEEAIGILSFLMKLAVLRLVPFVFGVGCVVGSLVILFSTIQLFGEGGAFAGMMAIPAVTGVLALGLLPFVAYLLFLVYYLTIDLMRSVLVLPGKLDALREEADTGEEA
jgi:hypothetical protein